MKTALRDNRAEFLQAWHEKLMVRLTPAAVVSSDESHRRRIAQISSTGNSGDPKNRSVYRELARLYDQLEEQLVNSKSFPNGKNEEQCFPTGTIARHFAVSGSDPKNASDYPFDLASIVLASENNVGKREKQISNRQSAGSPLPGGFNERFFFSLLERMSFDARQSFDEARRLINELKKRELANGALAGLPRGARCPSALPGGTPGDVAPANGPGAGSANLNSTAVIGF